MPGFVKGTRRGSCTLAKDRECCRDPGWVRGEAEPTGRAPLPCWLGPCRVRCKHPRRDRGTESWDSTKTEKEQLEKEKGLVHTGLCLGLCNKAQNA